jgi:two-component system, NtrC family, response regulator AtoC
VVKDDLPSTLGSAELKEAAKGRLGGFYALQVIGASGTSTVIVRPDKTLRVGRRRDSEIVVEHPGASRDHALIHPGEPPEIEDLASNNGTRVQGNLIPPRTRTPLPVGSVVEIAGTILHVRHLSSSPDEEARADVKTWSLHPGTDREQAVVVRDRRMMDLYQLAERVAASGMAVLILGETGVGKELVAERVHAFSPRRDRPFFRVNCAALAEGILASELFGHERGAFTGAHATKVGLFEAANGGTVFLDEIGELSMETQAKLLRVLETGEVTRVGSHQSRQVDVRIVSATNRNLAENIARGRFRSDLFFRLNGVSLTIPLLRDRPDDIVALAEFFAQRCAAMMAMASPVLSDGVKAALLRYRWPGNVRELKNVIERAVVLNPGPLIETAALQFDFAHGGYTPTVGPPPPSTAAASVGPASQQHFEMGRHASASENFRAADRAVVSDTMDSHGPRSARTAGRLKSARRAEQLRAELARAERDRIIEALNQAGNQAGAAKLLGLSRRALIYRLELYDIPRPRKGNKPSS